MLCGFRRPRAPDYLAMYCRALELVLKIDEDLRPFMQEQVRLLEQDALNRQGQAALRHVYGPDWDAQKPPIPAAESVNKR